MLSVDLNLFETAAHNGTDTIIYDIKVFTKVST